MANSIFFTLKIIPKWQSKEIIPKWQSNLPRVPISWFTINKSPFFREDDACPDECNRRCRRRTRLCNGPYHLACAGQGRAEEFDDCPALNNADPATGFQRTSTTTANFALYTNRAGDQSSNSDDYNQRHNNETADTADRGPEIVKFKAAVLKPALFKLLASHPTF